MTTKELKENKPKYPETTLGTHCMGENWTVCCPNKHLQYDRYIPTKQVVNVYYKGGIYRVFVCTVKCLNEVKNLAKNNPALFKKTFIKSVKSNGDLILKHRDTGIAAQVAKKIDTYTEKTPSKKGKPSKIHIEGGGRSRRHSRCSRKRTRRHTIKHRR
jgi:hypothetical protein